MTSYQSFLALDLYQTSSILHDVYGNDVNISESGVIDNRSSNIGNISITGNTISSNLSSIVLQPEGSNVINVTGHRISNIADPVDSGDSVSLSYAQSHFMGSGSTGNIGFSANTISSTNAGGNIILSPNGSGIVQITKDLDMGLNNIQNCLAITVNNGIFGTLSTANQPNITNVGTLPTLTATSITSSTISGTLLTNAQPNITSIGTLTTLNAANVVATNLTGTLQTGSQPNVTSVGTLGSLSVSGNISGTLITASQPNITTIGTLATLNATSVVATNLTGTLQTASQPNITTIGTLGSLSVSGNISGTLTTAAQPNITSLGTQAATLNMNNNNLTKINILTTNQIQGRSDITRR